MSDYYWCLTHERVEEGASCRARDRMGPYPSPAAARGWRDRVEERNDTWEAEDERWHGSDGDGDGDASVS